MQTVVVLVMLVGLVPLLIHHVRQVMRERAEIRARVSGKLVFSEDHVRIAHTVSRLGGGALRFSSGYVRITGGEAFIMLSGGKSLCLSFHRGSASDPKPPGRVLDVVAVRREKRGIVVESEIRFGSHTLRLWPRDPEAMFAALDALKRRR